MECVGGVCGWSARVECVGGVHGGSVWVQVLAVQGMQLTHTHTHMHTLTERRL